MNRSHRHLATLVAVGAIGAAALGLGTATAQAAPTVNPVAALVAAGVPANVAATAASATPVAQGTQQINLANAGNGNPGMRVDALIDHGRHTVTVIQRGLYERSQLTAAAVNLSTGKVVTTGLPTSVPNGPVNYPDRVGVLATGAGPVIVVVYGPTPPQTSLIPTLNYILPIPVMVTV